MTDTYVISLQTLLEEALATEQKNFTGNVRDLEEIFSEKNWKVLKNTFPGVFAFLGFHPSVDKSITSYVCSPSISSDSGADILVLFTLNDFATSPTIVDNEILTQLKIDINVHPSYTLIRHMFKDPAVLNFPGIIFFEDLLQVQNPIYLHISDTSSEDTVRQQMRQFFALADKAYQITSRSDKSFMNNFALTLQKEQIPYERGSDISMREWLVYAFRLIWKYKGDIVSVIKLFPL